MNQGHLSRSIVLIAAIFSPWWIPAQFASGENYNSCNSAAFLLPVLMWFAANSALNDPHLQSHWNDSKKSTSLPPYQVPMAIDGTLWKQTQNQTVLKIFCRCSQQRYLGGDKGRVTMGRSHHPEVATEASGDALENSVSHCCKAALGGDMTMGKAVPCDWEGCICELSVADIPDSKI